MIDQTTPKPLACKKLHMNFIETCMHDSYRFFSEGTTVERLVETVDDNDADDEAGTDADADADDVEFDETSEDDDEDDWSRLISDNADLEIVNGAAETIQINLQNKTLSPG